MKVKSLKTRINGKWKVFLLPEDIPAVKESPSMQMAQVEDEIYYHLARLKESAVRFQILKAKLH